MPMILVADDSEADRMVITEMLKKEPLDWLVEVVSSAEEAMALMREMAFDVVITDVLMAGMSGLDLLNHVHRQPHRVPVIVISGQDDQSAAVEALRQGAASYVPKSHLASRLGETVKQVLELAQANQNYQDLIGCAEEMRFQFKLANDPALIQPLVGLLQQMANGMGILSDEAQTRLGIAVDEAVINAMCHGNLELSDDDMADVRRHVHSGDRIEGITSRRDAKPYCDRQAHIAAGLSREGIKVVVRDEGDGFSLPSAKCSSSEHRGLTLIQNLVDKASFNDAGNEITLIKFRDLQPRSKSA